MSFWVPLVEFPKFKVSSRMSRFTKSSTGPLEL
jgi:hypothetical protein